MSLDDDTAEPPLVAVNLAAGLAELAKTMPTDLRTREDISRYRAAGAVGGTSAPAVAAACDLTWEEQQTSSGCPMTIFRPMRCTARAIVLFLHGGGLVAGNRFDGADVIGRHANELGLEVRTLEYPLAPEFTFDEMIRAARDALSACARTALPVVIAGQSGGGCLAAATAIDARDHDVPLAGQLLVCPMLDRRPTPSRLQYAAAPPWSAQSDATAWRMALAGSRTRPPGERDDLTGLPPTFLDTGTAELFRDAIIGYAERLCAAGVSTELHMWSGAFHGSDCVIEDAAVSRQQHHARADWLRRLVDGEL